MEKKNKYYVVRDKALPEVLQKVVEVKRLLEADKKLTVQEAAEQVGLSRSSFYKYKDDILPFSDNTRGKTVTLVTQMMDEPGLLSDLLHIVADYRANILTIHQTIRLPGSSGGSCEYPYDPPDDPGKRIRDGNAQCGSPLRYGKCCRYG